MMGTRLALLAGGMLQTEAEIFAISTRISSPRPMYSALVPPFADPDVGMVQARWGHLNLPNHC